MRISDWSSDVCSSDLVLAAGLCAATLALAAPLPASAAQQAALSPDDVATLGRVERYLNDIKTLQGRFVQTSSNGAYAEGAVYLDRPGHMRFDYDPPTPVLIIANGLSLLYYDEELKEARSEEHTSELQSLMRISYAVFCLKK